MTDNELLQAIADMMDQKLDEKLDQKLDEKLDEKLAALESRLEKKLEEKLEQKLEEKLDKKFDEKWDEKLLVISGMIDDKLVPIYDRLKNIELTQENDILPRLQNIEDCYSSTYKRYQAGVSQIEAMQEDVNLLKRVVAEHSQKLQMMA